MALTVCNAVVSTTDIQNANASDQIGGILWPHVKVLSGWRLPLGQGLAPRTSQPYGLSGFHRGIDGVAQPLDDGVDVGGRRDERRGDEHVVAAPAIDGAAHRVDHQSVGHSRLLDSRVQLQRRVERRLGAAACNEFDGLEQAAAAYVADIVVVAEPLV